nr:nucleoside-diphosphate sugar epimerase/dehydratase [Paraferrimonas haliotis]
MLTKLFELNRLTKRLISATIDSLCLLFAFCFSSYLLTPPDYYLKTLQAGIVPMTITILASILLFIKLGLYRAILRYVGLQVVKSIVTGVAFSALILWASLNLLSSPFPHSIVIVYLLVSLLLVGGSRITLRLLLEMNTGERGVPILIYGAGVSGRQVYTSLTLSHEYMPAGFIDDNLQLQKTTVHGKKVYARDQLTDVIAKQQIKKILLAIPSATPVQRKNVINSLQSLSVEIQTIPSLAELVQGKKSYADINDVGIEDLLGRDVVPAKPELLSKNITNKVVMVTGAGGSIGSELCRQILKQKPKSLVLFELSEFGLYAIDRELQLLAKNLNLDTKIIPLIGSVQRQNRLEAIMLSMHVQTVYHAAAYKHVPLVEYNVVEGVRNNVFGTYATAKAALTAQVETFVLISTDKAVRPTNVMGATKRLSELSLQSLAALGNHNTTFSMVRFGNVLGSSGSVVPLFRNQIANGGPVTVTHPEITRYFMTIPEASQLVIQAGAMAKGGDVFVLDMGESVKIRDLAEKMIKLSGLRVKGSETPNGDIEIRYSGLRPGEKLYEELLVGSNVVETSHERIMSANESSLTHEKFKQLMNELDTACHDFDHLKIRELLLTPIIEFSPTDEICDLLWLANKRSLE